MKGSRFPITQNSVGHSLSSLSSRHRGAQRFSCCYTQYTMSACVPHKVLWPKWGKECGWLAAYRRHTVTGWVRTPVKTNWVEVLLLLLHGRICLHTLWGANEAHGVPVSQYASEYNMQVLHCTCPEHLQLLKHDPTRPKCCNSGPACWVASMLACFQAERAGLTATRQ
jgi:hypothetical protein